MDDDALLVLAERIASVDGGVAVALGGSRARGTHRPDSDTDLPTSGRAANVRIDERWGVTSSR